MAERAAEECIRQPWEQMDGEPNLWFGRFQVYLGLGPMRSVKAAVTAAAAGPEAGTGTGAGKPRKSSGIWSRHCRVWRWRERAQAWDAQQRNLLAVAERNSRAALKSRRLDVIGDYIDVVREVLNKADLEEADKAQAREWLPQMSKMLLDLLEAERKECEGPEYTRQDLLNAAPITADDLRAAQRLLESEGGGAALGSGDRRHPLQPLAVAQYPSSREYREVRPSLLVCVGPDPALALELSVLRKVRAATGLQYLRLVDLSRRKFADTLRRERGFGRPVKLLHMAAHASAEGVQFADGPVDGEWLSERLEGVEVMVLAGRESDEIGEWLGVVPYVVTVDAALGEEDAAVLSQHFWQNIAVEMEAPEALEEALGHCAAGVSEYVVRHW